MNRLKLLALDEEDLSVISAHVQDAVLKVADLQFRPAEKRFLAVVNRFAWERAMGWFRRRFERRRTVLRFDRVLHVRHAGFDLSDGEAVLSLLAIRFLPADPPTGTIELIFSGGAAVRLEAECIEVELADLGPAWRTRARPVHQL
jgi:hypothetical protein